MAIPIITPYSGGVANPDGSQTQSEFTQNMFDQLSYEAQLANELNATVNATNATASEVASDAAIAQNSADSAQAAANFEGDFTVGVTSAVKGKSYSYNGNVWLCLQNTTSTPSTANSAWKLSVGEQYVTEAQEDLLPHGSSLFKGDDGVYLKDGDTVPAGTTHLRVLVNGKVTITKLEKFDATGDFPVVSAPVSLNLTVIPYSCVIDGESYYLRKTDRSRVNPLAYWAAGDYLFFNGNINPSPTDDTECIRAAIKMANTNGAIEITAFHYTTEPLTNPGILSMKSPMIPTLYRKASQGIPRPYGIANETTHLFRHDSTNKQCAYQFSGLTFYGNGSSDSSRDATNGLFDTTGKNPITDYFNVHMDGCDTRRVTGIDGRLGSWLWKLANSDFSGQEIALDLYQPHGLVLEKCGFNFRNKQDIRTEGGTALTIRDNAMDFDVAYKEIGAELTLLQGCDVYGNYAEEYNSSGNPLVNGGRGTDVLILQPGHFVPNSVPVIRNNYYAAFDVQRLITIRRDPSEEGFFTHTDLWIHDITVNGIAGDVIYHDHAGDPIRTLTMRKPRIQASQSTEYTIADPNGSLRFKGADACTIVDYTAVSPSNGVSISTASPTYLRNDKNFNERTDGWQFLTTGTEITFDFDWDRSDDQQFFIEITTTGGGFINKKIHQTGSAGSASANITLPYGQGGVVSVKLTKISSYVGAVVDNFNMRVTIKGIQR